jgi:shikimate dehydrogenase
MVKKDLIKQFGLVGKNIDYSFSRSYFSSKFENEKKVNHRYVNYDLHNINQFKELITKKPIPKGLNVTIPYKKEVIPFLDNLSKEAETIKAVNTIVWDANGKTIGHNTDHTGFEKSLYEKIEKKPKKALILGTGGASGAIEFVLNKMDCAFRHVSRNPKENQFSYDQLSKKHLDKVDLIVNTTPLGTFPDTKQAPPIPYKYINSKHFLFDLIYNPKETRFLKEGRLRGAKTSNGYKMLVYQAEKSWKLWNQ